MISIQNKEIKAIHIADLTDLLKKYDQLENFNNGNVRCQICSDAISSMNIGSIKLVNKKFAFICSKTYCYNQIFKITQ